MNDSSSNFSVWDASLAIPAWEALVVIIFLPLIIIITIVGNILVIISVFTFSPLKITPNYFIVSLSMADLTVAIFVLPFNVIYILTGVCKCARRTFCIVGTKKLLLPPSFTLISYFKGNSLKRRLLNPYSFVVLYFS